MTAEIAPRISVIMGAYNAEYYIGTAIDSILNQTFRDFEFIIINDGSTDQTGRIIDSYATHDSRIIVRHQNNQGHANALNNAIKIARGQLIANMDADDIALPGRLEAQVDYLDKNPTIALVGTSIQIFMDDKNIPPRHSIYPEHAQNGELAHPTMLYKKDIVVSVGGYRSIYNPTYDYDLSLRVADSHQLRNIVDIHLLYRDHDKSLSTTLAVQQSLAAVIAELAAIERRAGRGDPTLGLPALTLETLALFPLKRKTRNKLLARIYQGSLKRPLERNDRHALMQHMSDIVTNAQPAFWNRTIHALILIWLVRNVWKQGDKSLAFLFLQKLLWIAPWQGLRLIGRMAMLRI